jgi:hypothetical protein
MQDFVPFFTFLDKVSQDHLVVQVLIGLLWHTWITGDWIWSIGEIIIINSIQSYSDSGYVKYIISTVCKTCPSDTLCITDTT